MFGTNTRTHNAHTHAQTHTQTHTETHTHARLSFAYSIESGGRWQRSDRYKWHAPTIYKGSFTLNKMPEDTFADMSVSDQCS